LFNNGRGIIIAGIAIAGLILAGKFGKELKVKTLGDLAEKIAREHYLNAAAMLQPLTVARLPKK
jgi:hypothetical protein